MGFRALVVAAVFCLSNAAQAQTILQITGEGSVLAAPDMAVISLRVSRQGRTAAVVTADMAQAARAVLGALDAVGIAERDVQTSALQLNPRWNRALDGQAAQIIGYEASTGLEVRVRDLDRFGAVLDAVIEEGANGFQGVRFALAEPRPAQDEARAGAFRDAMAKAQLYADLAGLEIAEIRSIREGGGAVPQPFQEGMMMRSMAADVPVASGELAVTMQVTLEVVLGPDAP